MVVVRCQISDARCRNRRPATHVEGPAAAVYTGGHLLEFCSKSANLRHFLACLAWRPEGKARSASRFMPRRSDLTRGVLGDQETLWHRHPEKCHIDFRLLSTTPSTRHTRFSGTSEGVTALLPGRGDLGRGRCLDRCAESENVAWPIKRGRKPAQSSTPSWISSEFPRNSGAYIAQARAGRAWNLPGISARRRYETLCLPRASVRLKKATRSSRNST
jgi:hypothetical protein